MSESDGSHSCRPTTRHLMHKPSNDSPTQPRGCVAAYDLIGVLRRQF
ncbi:hypothetical protein EDC27_0569 [Desulfosoma caldarium]|uniref:Uncharacterized protein n=1 Tax=Desulfosoma caldarium TaxID=610254 RepID=A0A3N1VKG4_9BACT|nr:hypothetical protein EDC27_0569 [Desulfosoma caldarium]